MFTRMKNGLAVVSLAAMMFTGTVSAEITTPQALRFQATAIGSNWYLFAATYSKMLQESLPPKSVVDVVAKGGGVANYLAVDLKKVDIAITNTSLAVWGWAGDKEVFKGKQYQNARAIAGGMNSAWVMGMARNDFLKKTGQKNLEEVLTSGKPVRIVMKPIGSAPAMMADKIFAACGTSVKQIKANGGSVTYVGVDQIASIMRDGLADVYIELAIRNQPTISEISITTDVSFLDMPAKFLEQGQKQGLAISNMPVMFKGQTKPIPSFDMGAVFVVHKDTPDDLAYIMAKAFSEKTSELGAASKAWLKLDPSKCVSRDVTGIPLHPGAAKYYKERGWQ